MDQLCNSNVSSCKTAVMNHAVTTTTLDGNCLAYTGSKSCYDETTAPEVHSDEIYCMDYISDMKVTDSVPLTEEGGLLYIEDSWRSEWEKPIQVTRRVTLERELEITDAPNECILSNCLNGVCNVLTTIPPEIVSPSDWGGLTTRGLIKDKDLNSNSIMEVINVDNNSTTTTVATCSPVSSQLNVHHTLEHTLTTDHHALPPVHNLDGALNNFSPRYNCDDVDLQWIQTVNEDIAICNDVYLNMNTADAAGTKAEERETPQTPQQQLLFLTDNLLEFVFDFLEETTHSRIQTLINSEKADGIEYDENTLCDVCREGTCEEGNEILFCDKCDIAVHQGCYGIANIPDGDWLCRTCYLGIKPPCFLCSQRGGAMKSTLNGKRWCHVSCVLWIPETSFGDLYKMEPVVHLKSIPESRWNLVCTLCRDKVGACIQCSFKTCAISYHVTCGYNSKLEVTTTQHPVTGDLLFKSYCSRHTAERRKKINSTQNYPNTHQKLSSFAKNGPKFSPHLLPGKLTPMDRTESNEAILKHRINKALCKFHTLVTPEEMCRKLNLRPIQASMLYEYWKLKRISRALFQSESRLCDSNTSTGGEKNGGTAGSSENNGFSVESGLNCGLVDMSLSEEQQKQLAVVESLRNRAAMFVALRQDCEKVRNMVNMIQKRERALKTYHRVCYEMFKRQLILTGFNELPEFLCPPSDLAVIHSRDDVHASSADEGIGSGEFSDSASPNRVNESATNPNPRINKLKRRATENASSLEVGTPKVKKKKLLASRKASPSNNTTSHVIINSDKRATSLHKEDSTKAAKSSSTLSALDHENVCKQKSKEISIVIPGDSSCSTAKASLSSSSPLLTNGTAASKDNVTLLAKISPCARLLAKQNHDHVTKLDNNKDKIMSSTASSTLPLNSPASSTDSQNTNSILTGFSISSTESANLKNGVSMNAESPVGVGNIVLSEKANTIPSSQQVPSQTNHRISLHNASSGERLKCSNKESVLYNLKTSCETSAATPNPGKKKSILKPSPVFAEFDFLKSYDTALTTSNKKKSSLHNNNSSSTAKRCQLSFPTAAAIINTTRDNSNTVVKNGAVVKSTNSNGLVRAISNENNSLLKSPSQHTPTNTPLTDECGLSLFEKLMAEDLIDVVSSPRSATSKSAKSNKDQMSLSSPPPTTKSTPIEID